MAAQGQLKFIGSTAREVEGGILEGADTLQSSTGRRRGGFAPGVGIIPLRKEAEEIEREVFEAREQIAALEAEPEIDFEAIQDDVDRELARLLRLQAEAQMFELQQRLEALRLRRARLNQLLDDILFVILSAA